MNYASLNNNNSNNLGIVSGVFCDSLKNLQKLAFCDKVYSAILFAGSYSCVCLYQTYALLWKHIETYMKT